MPQENKDLGKNDILEILLKIMTNLGGFSENNA